MLAVDFPGTNTTFGKPADMTDEQGGSFPAHAGLDSDGLPCVTTAWQPNYEDLQALNAARPLLLQLIGGRVEGNRVVPTMPPVALWTYDENKSPNF